MRKQYYSTHAIYLD